ncbi:Methyltranfer-dom domain-containing protein [Mycena kentingensis (nom. inval.)]|nr:Methyltranfer-dom domain-containing protein [Mycena kentingensis (nom. inval.)]
MSTWKLAAHPSWPKFSVAFLLFATFYLLAREAFPHSGKYHDLLSTIDRDALIAHPHTSRLVRTLEGNERRYQFTIGEREKLITKTGARQIAAFPPPRTQFYVLWDFFIPAFTCPFPMYRVGTLADGGKWVCGLDRVLHNRRRPIVYSLGYQTPAYSSFEQDILQRSPELKIYGFDSNSTAIGAAHWPWGEDNVQHDTQLASRVHFNTYSFGDLKATKYRSMQSVMKSLGHDFVDILKVDLEGDEFATMASIIADSGSAPLPFGQLLLEVHIGWSDDMTTVDHFAKWWERLEAAGLRPFYFEVSMMDVNNLRAEPAVVYWSLINVRGRHALVDDSLPEFP